MNFVLGRIRSLLLLCSLVAVFAGPAAAQVLYTNGPADTTVDGFTINYSYVISDSFNLSASSTLGSVDFTVWVIPETR